MDFVKWTILKSRIKAASLGVEKQQFKTLFEFWEEHGVMSPRKRSPREPDVQMLCSSHGEIGHSGHLATP